MCGYADGRQTTACEEPLTEHRARVEVGDVRYVAAVLVAVEEADVVGQCGRRTVSQLTALFVVH